MKFRALIRECLDSGVSSRHSGDVDRAVAFCNQMTLVSSVLTWVFAAIEFVMGFYAMAIADVLFGLLFLAPIYLHRRGSSRWAHLFFLFFGNAYVFYCSSVQGEGSGIFLAFFPLTGFPFLLLARESLSLRRFLSLLPVALYSLLKLTSFRPLPFFPDYPAPPLFFGLSILCGFYLCYVSMKIMDRIHRDSHRRQEVLLSELKAERDVVLEQQAKLIGSAKMAALGEMAAGIAHEINNPLTSIHLLSNQILLAQKVQPAAPLVGESARKIQLVVDRVSRIVEALRHFTRKSDLSGVGWASLNQLVADTLEICGPRFRGESVDLQSRFPSAELRVRCHSVLLSQALLNLLNNAMDSVASVAKGPVVSVSLSQVGDFAEIVVGDNGPGVAREVQDKIFDPFFTTKAVGSGVGLGLSLAKGIAESHGGTLELIASPAGARFSFRIPMDSNDLHP